jgi:hypothetical protein
VTVGAFHAKVPKRLQGDAGSKNHSRNEDVVGHNHNQKSVSRTAGPGVGPDADVEEQNGDLGEPKAKYVEKYRIPAGLEKRTAMSAEDTGCDVTLVAVRQILPLPEGRSPRAESTMRATLGPVLPLQSVAS